MAGSFGGNLIGISYFLIFQIIGIAIASLLLKKEKWGFTILIGSVFGSFSLQWMPTLVSFCIGFNTMSHILALAAFVILFVFLYTRKRESLLGERSRSFSLKKIVMEDPIVFLLIPTFLVTAIILTNSTLSAGEGLALHSGQSTYGDMNMHLGFITSIAKQQIFPPEYSILPGTKLAYPFLSDSISSSLYVWGTSLRVAYLVPMYFALLQVFFGMYEVSKILLRPLGNSFRGKSILAFALFFFNGGFGFYYFINRGFNSENFTRIFTEFYQTPTNYVQANVQWHNILCDMLIPQRATLFGWAVLFPVLALLLKARSEKNNKYYVLSAILAGGLVLIHTHSFLALGVSCAVFVVQDLASTSGETKIQFTVLTRFLMVAIALALLSVIGYTQLSDEPFSANTILAFGAIVILIYGAVFVYQIWSCSKDKKILIKTLVPWGVFLAIVVVLALPQLLGFTFQQAQGEQFVRGSFNWANNNPEVADNYIIFYLKNLGVMFILPVLLLIFGSKGSRRIAMPGIFLWMLCEFILFQPNPYDNNKLLLVAYLYLCIAAADFVWETVPKLWKGNEEALRASAITIISVLGVFAAVLTIGREWVADFELYDDAYVHMAQWVEENTQPTDIFLTANNHNNAVASLTGRNIVCGSGTFLHFHGLNYGQAENDVKQMYENPEVRQQLLEQYNVNYIVLGNWELGSYQIPDADILTGSYPVVYAENNIVVLKVK